MKIKFTIGQVVGVMVLATLLCGCEPKNVDPEAKVDAPGYYNGPMQPRGSRAPSKASAKASTEAKSESTSPDSSK